MFWSVKNIQELKFSGKSRIKIKFKLWQGHRISKKLRLSINFVSNYRKSHFWTYQCCGSMTCWCGSGSWFPGSRSYIFVIDPQDAIIITAYYFLKVLLHHFSKIKSQKESQNSRNQGFSYYFCMILEGSGKPKNMWIRIRIWISNTGTYCADRY